VVNPLHHHVSEPKSLIDLAALAGAELHNQKEANIIISDVAPLNSAGENDISFLDNAKYKDDFTQTKASACIVHEKMLKYAPKDCALLISKSPYKSYALIAQAFYPKDNSLPCEPTISDHAIISETAKIGQGCTIEAGAVIGNNVIIGDNSIVESNAVIRPYVRIGNHSRIGAGASISHATIGDYTRLYPGVRVGQDGFGFAIDPAGHVKVPQLGSVVIGNHVEIGANSCIDRGAGPDTVIGDGTWIDNLVQIGHNATIGKGCVIVAQAGIAGSTTLEDYIVVAAQVGIAGHLTIGKGTRIGAQSGVMHNLPSGASVLGTPALPIKQQMRIFATLKKMVQK